MHFRTFDNTELQEAWIEEDESARWRSSSGHGPRSGAQASGSSLLEVDPGHRLPPHTDSAEEIIVVIAGTASVRVAGEDELLETGGVALVPSGARHEVRNAGRDRLRFAAVYAGTEVVTTYDDEVQPEGGRERRPVD